MIVIYLDVYNTNLVKFGWKPSLKWIFGNESAVNTYEQSYVWPNS